MAYPHLILILVFSLFVGTCHCTAAEAGVGADYKIAPSDLVVVSVLGEKDWEKLELRVSNTGTINVPYLKEVNIKDKTTAQVAALLHASLKPDYFVDPQLVVTVKEYSKRLVTVIGQVMKQGVVSFPAEQELNLLEAIGAAEGFTKLANSSKITITRSGKAMKFDLAAWRKNPEKTKLPSLEPGDVVFVPEVRW